MLNLLFIWIHDLFNVILSKKNSWLKEREKKDKIWKKWIRWRLLYLRYRTKNDTLDSKSNRMKSNKIDCYRISKSNCKKINQWIVVKKITWICIIVCDVKNWNNDTILFCRSCISQQWSQLLYIIYHQKSHAFMCNSIFVNSESIMRYVFRNFHLCFRSILCFDNANIFLSFFLEHYHNRIFFLIFFHFFLNSEKSDFYISFYHSRILLLVLSFLFHLFYFYQ